MSEQMAIPGLTPDTPLQDVKAEDVSIERLVVDDPGEPPDAAFVRSVETLGFLQPIRVRADDEGRLRVVAGRRRYAAARRLGWETVPVVYETRRSGASEILGLAEQYQRSPNPVAEYRLVAALRERGWSTEAIARAAGMSQKQVQRRLLLGNAPPEILVAVEAGDVAASVAEAMATVPDATGRRLLARFRATGKLTGKDVTEERRALTASAVASLAFDVPDLPYEPNGSAPDRAPSVPSSALRLDECPVDVLVRAALDQIGDDASTSTRIGRAARSLRSALRYLGADEPAV